MAVWRFKKMIILIGLYEREPVLWDPDHPEYEHERKSDEAWERIRMELGARMGRRRYEVEDLKREMSYLKQMYHQHKRENTIPKNSSNNNYFHKLDPFLGKTSTYVITTSSTQVERIGDTEDAKVALDQKLRDLATKDDVKELRQQVVNLQLENNTLREEIQKIGDSEDVKVKDAGVPQQEDVCGLYAKLLAEKLRQLPERERHFRMLEIDGTFSRDFDVK